MNEQVRVILPNMGEHLFKNKKKRVCAYARVSNEDRDTSYENQISEYTRIILKNDEWIFKGIYSDNGITGYSVDKRVGFLRMIRDSKINKIDLIITKSISRFARNTIDCLRYIRKLKSYGTEVYFEKENLYTFDSSTELILSIMSSVAEEELISVSLNRKWQILKSFKDGYPALGKVLGYDIADKYNYIINEEQSNVVRFIYSSFIETKSVYKTKKLLESQDIKTVTGKDSWSRYVIKYILTNPVYIGDLKLHKQINIDGKKVFNSIAPSYYVQNHHTSIISNNDYNLVSNILNEIKVKSVKLQKKKRLYPYSGLAYCGICGSVHRRKTTYYKQEVSGVIYACSNALDPIKNKQKCTQNSINEVLLEKATKDFIENTVLDKEFQIKLINHLAIQRTEDILAKKKDEFRRSFELELKRLKHLESIEHDPFIAKKIETCRSKIKQLNIESTLIENALNQKYSIDYLLLMFDELEDHMKKSDIITNHLLKTVIHKIIIKDNENIYFVFTSDNNNQAKTQINLNDLKNSRVLKRHVNKLQHKNKILKLTYKVIFR